ncbi:NAD(P)H-binding protein [Nocardiopsis sp. RSe5-2]|uniref:NAD(P)H-binding protein n=1 Tax=Nocardiopsis endophytica TaxID=3018445 RepID=A0ABT4UE26_9ACTN|nr:NAD(P)H-binding protein [Nocardiopsis endophytica]MDA2815245.1 NAD(P)H-binding protein [Nocardiopsis endophytica]
MTRTVLITGATGTVSTALMGHLKGADVRIRALVRDPAKADAARAAGAEVVAGDLGRPSTLGPAFEGVQDVWLLVPNGPRAPEHSMNAMWAARSAGAGRVVRLSAVGAAHDAPTRSGRLHALSDAEAQRSGLEWTLLRPMWFMDNLLGEAAEVRATGGFGMDMGQGRLGMVAADDVAACAARVLADGPGVHGGRAYTLTGPESLGLAEAAERMGEALGRPVAYRPVSTADKRAALLAVGADEWIADMVGEYSAAFARGWGDFTTPDAGELLGRPPQGVADFARANAAAFGG